MIRNLMHDIVSSIAEPVFGSRIYAPTLIEEINDGHAPELPFIVIRKGPSAPPVPRLPGTMVRQVRIQVWCHFARGSVVAADSISVPLYNAIDAELDALTGTNYDEQFVFMSGSLEDVSSDLVDDQYGTLTMYATYLLTYKSLMLSMEQK